MTCDNCLQWYDPVAFRWLCPECGWKAHCCEGQATPPGRAHAT